MDSNHRFGIANREAISTALLWALLLWAGLLPTRAQTPQSLSWTEPMDGTILLLGKGYPLTATASSGLPVTFKVTGGPAEIRVGQLIATNLGRITVQAEQAGTSTFARVAVERSFNEPSPVLEKQFASPGKVRATQYGLVVSGKRLYVAQEIAGLRILDVTDPEKPVTLGVRATEGIASVSVAVAGNTVFISDDIGLRALDVSDPANIKDLAYTTELGGSLDFDVEGNRLVTWDPLRIVDVSDPRNFKLVGSVEEYGRGDIEKGLAYISDWYAARLRVIDFRNPSDIRELGAVDNVSVGLIHEVAVSGSIAHVVGDLGYAMIDVGTPSRPRELAYFRMPDPCFEVGVHGTKVVVTDGANTVHVLETANRASIKEVWSGRAGPWWTSVPLPISDGKAYLQGINGSVVVLDLNSAGGARVLSEFTFGGWAFGIDLFGGRPWLADEFGGLKVFDPDLSNPVEHHFGFEVMPQGLDRFGDRAVVVGGGLEGGARLDVLSVSNGSPGQIIGTWKAAMGPGNVQSVLLENHRAYVVGAGLHVYDLLDPRNPKWLGEVPARHANPNAIRPVPNWNLQSVGGSVFFGNIGGIFKVDDLSPTQPPRLVLGKPLEVGTLPFRIRDGFLYCVSSGRLEVWDIHDLGAPNLLGSLEIDIYWVNQLVLDKNTAYLRGAEQIVAVDISSPATPKVRSTFRPSSGVSSIAVEDGIFYAYGPQGLEIFDVQNPSTPESLALWENEASAQQIQVRNRSRWHSGRTRPPRSRSRSGTVSHSSRPMTT